MPAQFDLGTTKVTEFGVGIDDANGERFVVVPVDAETQAVLRQMVFETRSAMKEADSEVTTYNPSQKHAAQENLHLPLNHALAENIRRIHQANNLDSDPSALEGPDDVFCYFTRLSDGKGSYLTAIRRATSFKGILKSNLLRLINDALRFVDDKVFRLDRDFDLLVDAAGVHILRPAGFEFVGGLREAVMGAAPANIKAIKADLPFVEFATIETFALRHPRAARYLASIRQQETKNIDKSNLKRLCKSTGVNVTEVNGKLVVEDDSIMDFLGVLDRRLYWLELIKGSPESFRAASRTKIVKPAVTAGNP